MKYTIKLSKKGAELYDRVYDTLDLVFSYALTEYVLYDGKPGEMVLESDEDAECELDRILPLVGDILGVRLSYESADGDGDDEEDEE